MCLYPIHLKGVDAFGIDCMQTVPCGKCVECLKDRQNAWKIRLCEEYKDHLFCYFFTLTYNDSSVPFEFDDDGVRRLTLRKSDVQLWLKRNRMYFSRRLHKELDFKYFICGEYGPNTGRPHYHGIVFTELSPSLFARFMSDWSSIYGFVNWSNVAKKKEVQDRSRIMSLNTAVNLLSFGQTSKEIYTDFPRLEYYRRLSIL